MVLLTAFLSFLCVIASWGIEKAVKGYFSLFLILEAGMMGVFCALDFFLFYVFWEVMLLPMYFLIGIWGGPRREYAAIKFFLYTLAGSVLMLLAMIAFIGGLSAATAMVIVESVALSIMISNDLVIPLFVRRLLRPWKCLREPTTLYPHLLRHLPRKTPSRHSNHPLRYPQDSNPRRHP